jgi:hypothetical protein
MHIVTPKLGDAAATKLGRLPLISHFDGNDIRLGAGSVGFLIHLIAYLPACIS